MNPIHLERCRNHPDREAAVRCPGCSRYYCRECAGEHGGRLLCAECVAAAVRPRTSRARSWSWVATPLQCLGGLFVGWLVFGLIGWVLMEIPDDFHEGTYWQFLDPGDP